MLALGPLTSFLVARVAEKRPGTFAISSFIYWRSSEHINKMAEKHYLCCVLIQSIKIMFHKDIHNLLVMLLKQTLKSTQAMADAMQGATKVSRNSRLFFGCIIFFTCFYLKLRALVVLCYSVITNCYAAHLYHECYVSICSAVQAMQVINVM
jgi:hypothetical protein